ncbi:MAG: aminoacyl--tRNA ligase-related protein [Candidatus Bathyarchaeia archaeon]
MLKGIRMFLECTITLSSDASNAENRVKEIMDEANRSLLIKGTPKGLENEASKVIDWKISKNLLRIKLESGTYVRVHAALLRLKRVIGLMLGKEYKIGIRKLKVDKFILNFFTEKPLSEYSINKIKAIPLIKTVETKKEKTEILLEEMEEGDLKRNSPDRAINLIKEIIEESSKELIEKQIKPTLPVVKASREKPIKFNKDPMKVAIELGWIEEFPARGQWIYTVPFAQLFDIIKQILIEKIALKLSFKPFILPKLIPLSVMKRMPGYLDDIPEGMYYVCPPPREPKAFDEFKYELKLTGEISKEKLKKAIKEPEYVLAPAQCEPFWQFYSSRILKADEFPFKYYDCSGWTYRWEGGGVEGIVRLQEFQRIELTYVGTPDQVVSIRDRIVEECARVADEALEMEWRITAAIPFWAKGGEMAIETDDSKKIPAYDIEIYLPYRGSRTESEWLEVAGCFVHKTKFVESFKIREIKGRSIWTGCAGLGISRWVAAFLATHGFDPENWPKMVREKFDKEYKLPRKWIS